MVATAASRGEGIEELADRLDAHREWLDRTGGRKRRRSARAGAEVRAITLERVRAGIDGLGAGSLLPRLAESVAAGELDPYRAADELLGAVGTEWSAAAPADRDDALSAGTPAAGTPR